MLNHAEIQGRLVADPELRTTQSGTSVCSFRVAWSKKYKERETKLFLSCTAWGKQGEFVANNFVKGKEIIIEGELSTNEFTDKDGNKRSSIEMNVKECHFCGAKSDGGNYSAPYVAPPAAEQFTELTDDDGKLPF